MKRMILMTLILVMLVAVSPTLAQDETTLPETTSLIDSLTAQWQIIFFGMAAVIVVLLFVIVWQNRNGHMTARDLRDLVPTRAINDIIKEWNKRAEATPDTPVDDWIGDAAEEIWRRIEQKMELVKPPENTAVPTIEETDKALYGDPVNNG